MREVAVIATSFFVIALLPLMLPPYATLYTNLTISKLMSRSFKKKKY